jgi:hypothetical protein
MPMPAFGIDRFQHEMCKKVLSLCLEHWFTVKYDGITGKYYGIAVKYNG